MKELLTALVLAKQAFAPVKKDKINPHFGNHYASLDSILGAVEPALSANGLVLSHSVTEGCLSTRLYHSSGEYLESSIPLPQSNDPQKMGSLLSYYRRYAVSGLLSICADEDTDGNGQTEKASPLKVAPGERSELAYIREGFRTLEWSNAQKGQWAKDLFGKPSAEWSPEEWGGGKSDMMRLLEERAAL